MGNSTTARQVAISSLIGTLVLDGYLLVMILTKVPTAPTSEALPLVGTGLLWASFTLPLLLWGNKAGYAGAIVVGAIHLIGPLIAAAGDDLGGRALATPLLVVTYLMLAVALVSSSAIAWREHARGDNSDAS